MANASKNSKQRDLFEAHDQGVPGASETTRPKATVGTPVAQERVSTSKLLEPTEHPAEQERFLSDVAVAKRFSVSRQTVWRWAKQGSAFPKPVQLSPGTSRWRLSDLVDYESGLSK